MAVWFGLKEEIEKWEKKQDNIEYLCSCIGNYININGLEKELKEKGCYLVMLELPKIRKKWLEMMVVCRHLRIVRSLNELINALNEVNKTISLIYNKEIKKIDLNIIRKKYVLVINSCGIKDDICYYEVYKPKLDPLECSPSSSRPVTTNKIKWSLIIEDYPTSITKT